MKTYKTTATMGDRQMEGLFNQIALSANQQKVTVIANYGFGAVNAYILAETSDEQDANTLFPLCAWEELHNNIDPLTYPTIHDEGGNG